MATNLSIIGDALRELNVIAETETPSSEQGSHGLRKLNQMLEQWTEDDIDFGYFAQSSTGDTYPGPQWTERAVTLNLALEIAPAYGSGASVTPMLLANADSAKNTVLRKSINEKLRNTDMSHLPYGQGHFGYGRWDIDTDG